MGLTARQALGHPKPADRSPQISLFVDDPPRWIVVEGLSRGDLRRAGRYHALVSNLAQGRLRPGDFERRIRAWRPIAGFRFLSDPDAVLTLSDAVRATETEIFYYESGRS